MSAAARLASRFNVTPGQVIKGLHGQYSITGLWRDLTKGQICNKKGTRVIVKAADERSLEKEIAIIERLPNHAAVRHVLDWSQDPQTVVLSYLDYDAMHLMDLRGYRKPEIKQIARAVLEALSTVHSQGIAHSDIKPDNILLNYDRNTHQVANVQLADWADIIMPQHVKDFKDFKDYVIGAAVFRSPEALLGLEWDTSTDIWSFGATIISLYLQRDVFQIDEAIKSDDPQFPWYVLHAQHLFLGPFPPRQQAAMDKEILGSLGVMEHECGIFAKQENIPQEDRDFFGRIMKLEPSDRPSTEELLQDPWLAR